MRLTEWQRESLSHWFEAWRMRFDAEKAGRAPWSWASLPGLSIRQYDVGETKLYYSLGHGCWGWSLVPYEPNEVTPRWWLTSERRPEVQW